MSPNPALLTLPAPVAGGSVGPVHSFGGYASPGAASYTWTAVPIGAASASRLVVVTVHQRTSGNRTLSGVTIAGSPATVAWSGESAWRSMGLAWLVVPSGTTADVEATWNGPTVGAVLNVWTISGSALTLDGSASTPSSDGTSPDSMSCGSAPGGYVFGSAVSSGGGTGTTTLSGDIGTDWSQSSPTAAAGHGTATTTTATATVAYPSAVGIALAAVTITP